MNENILCRTIGELRRVSGMTQEQLAHRLGLTYQAVSKWENSLSCPDVLLLPEIADIFGVSIDELFGREAPAPALPAPVEVVTEQSLPWADDDNFYAVLYQGHRLIREPEPAGNGRMDIHLEYEGPAKNISSFFDVSCENVSGNIAAGGDISCENVSGDACAGGDISCEGVNGAVRGGGDVSCGEVMGSVSASGDVDCDRVEGRVSAGGDVSASEIGGNVKAGGDVSGSRRRGKSLHISFGGDVDDCDEPDEFEDEESGYFNPAKPSKNPKQPGININMHKGKLTDGLNELVNNLGNMFKGL